MAALSCRSAKSAALISLATILSCAKPAFAETADISAADTAWMIVATALVLMMTVPGLALFYSGMVRKKNVAWSGGVTYVLLKLVSAFVPLRVSREHELEGLDISQHGEALQ